MRTGSRVRFPFASPHSVVHDPFDGRFHRSLTCDGAPAYTRVLPCCGTAPAVRRTCIYQCLEGLDTRRNDLWDFFHDSN